MSIWRRGFWQTYWIALRRSGKDSRSRGFALKISFLFTYLIAYLLIFFVLPLRQRDGIWPVSFSVLMLALALGIRSIISRSHRRQDELLHFALNEPNERLREKTNSPPAKIRTYLEERAVILASLLARGASEIYLGHHELPPGFNATARQRQNSVLRQRGLWEKLEPTEADLMGAADGRWSTDDQHEVSKWCEQLRLLRWALGIDAELAALAHFPKLDFSLSHELLERSNIFAEGALTRRPSDLRIERDNALAYTVRLIAELAARTPAPEYRELKVWRDELRHKALGNSTDLLAGTRTIGELNEEELRSLYASSSARERYAAYLVEQLGSEEPLSFSTWSTRQPTEHSTPT